ncbi:MepB family protein [Shouchella miscanthi]|uniref:MepB family protein n=1 Tax=Shouchella miscanthi TaxID=2598861 RepID=A0ABU6NJD6_9BACI|nr:MepB family protein [Shouchella miscanthi]
MKNFYESLSYINDTIYKPIGLSIESAQGEEQNSRYGAGTFRTLHKTIRFRVANNTPNKIGQFVAVWKKDDANKNRPYTYGEALDLFVVTVFKNHFEFGQFVFPKDILVKKNLLKTDTTKGKMGFRVYPEWDRPVSKQGLKTQEWQMPYFVYMNEQKRAEILKLYA